MELAAIGNFKYYRAIYNQQYFKPIYRSIVLAMNGEFDYGHGLGGKPYPLFKNFYAGGIGSVRGAFLAALLFAAARHAADPAAGEPWALYAASNLGSFAGLMAYPLVAEPLLSLHAQSLGWTAGYALLIALVCLAARSRWHAAGSVQVAAAQSAPIPARRIMLWLALAAVPSGLMLSTTTHLTTDLFAMPLLWVIPLGLYLLSFVAAFSDRRAVAGVITLFAPPTMLLAGGLAYTVGVIFYVLDGKFRYSHFIWHLFVVAGSACHFIAVLRYAA